jgi:hypothetical protein
MGRGSTKNKKQRYDGQLWYDFNDTKDGLCTIWERITLMGKT